MQLGFTALIRLLAGDSHGRETTLTRGHLAPAAHSCLPAPRAQLSPTKAFQELRGRDGPEEKLNRLHFIAKHP